MSMLPDFSKSQKQELKSLGLCDEQLRQLRYALVIVKSVIDPPPERNVVFDLIDEVKNLSMALNRKLYAIDQRIDAAHAMAYVLLEQEYWQEARLDDDGSSIGSHLCPRLIALERSASAGIMNLPGSTRHRTGDWRPIMRIENALMHGWSEAHRSIRNTDGGKIISHTKPYPSNLFPSISVSSAFRRVVSICYNAVGWEKEPERAIRNYMRTKKIRRQDSIAAIDSALSDKNRLDRKTRNS